MNYIKLIIFKNNLIKHRKNKYGQYFHKKSI